LHYTLDYPDLLDKASPTILVPKHYKASNSFKPSSAPNPVVA